MKGDKGPDGVGGEDRRNPYPLPGVGWHEPEADPPPAPGVPVSKDGMPGPQFGGAPQFGGRSVRAAQRRIWLVFLGPFLVGMLIIISWAGYQFSRGSEDTGDDTGISSVPDSPEPEPVSTVRPKVKGWKAVTSAKYGMTYDVPPSWRIQPTETLIGFEGIGDGKPVAMSSAAIFREDSCKDGDDEYSRGDAGFNQYVEGGLTEVAKHAANKWAKHAYTVEGSPAPSITLTAPKAVQVGRDKAVYVRADVVVKAKGKCLSPTAVVHTVAIPGVAPGKTTVFVLLVDQGVPDAAPKADLTKILRSVRPNDAPPR